MSLDMLGATMQSKVLPAKQVQLRSPAPTSSVTAKVKAPKQLEDSPAEIATLVKELQALGGKYKDHRNLKIAALARKALTAAASLQIQGGHGPAVGAIASPAGVAAVSILQQLKAAVANEPQAPPPAAKAQTIAKAQAKLKTSAQKLVSSANALSAKTQKAVKKGKGSQAVANRGAKVATKLSDAGAKLLALAAKSVAPKIVNKVAIGDDLSDAQAQLAAAQQAVADAQAMARGVSDDLATAKKAVDALVPADPNWNSVQDDYTNATNLAFTLIFNDTSLADAANALADAQALVAAIQGLPPPSGGVQPPPPALLPPAGGASISPAQTSVAAGQQVSLSFQTPSPTTLPVLWSSTNSRVVSVDQQGNVTGIAPGAANITAMQGGALAQARVSVTGGAGATNTPGATVNPPQLNILLGQSQPPPLQFLVNGQLLFGPVTWTSSNPMVASVDQQGNVIPIAVGNVTITASQGANAGTATVVITDPNAQQYQTPAGGGGGGGGGYDGGGYGGGEGEDDGGGGYGGDDTAADAGTGDAGDESVWDDSAGDDDVAEDADTEDGDSDADSGDIGGLHMLGAIDYGSLSSALPGLLQTAGGALSGKQAVQQAQAQQVALQQKQAADEASARKMTIVKWVVGAAAGLVGLGVVGVLLRKVIR